ncbi:MAG TPA: hypothetical protein VFQ73_15330 [Flavisolibacter sp.]|nr:hypothetical protein [Flavisolibacter sp.]
MLKILLFACLLFSKNSRGQAETDSGFIFIRSYQGDVADAMMDHLDNLYIISSTGQIRKYNANGDSTGMYNQVRNFGKLTSLDVSNPLTPLLFYKDFSSVVVLDRFLSNRLTLDLRKYNILQPGAVGLSYDNNIWVFDEWDNKLKKIDEQGNQQLETPDFRTIFEETIRPQKIINDNGFVYLTDTAKGVYVFDNYGAFKKRIQLNTWESISVKENYLIQTRPGELSVYNTNTYTDVKKRLPGNFQPYLHSFSTASKLVTFNNDSLHIYQYKF